MGKAFASISRAACQDEAFGIKGAMLLIIYSFVAKGLRRETVYQSKHGVEVLVKQKRLINKLKDTDIHHNV